MVSSKLSRAPLRGGTSRRPPCSSEKEALRSGPLRDPAPGGGGSAGLASGQRKAPALGTGKNVRNNS